MFIKFANAEESDLWKPINDAMMGDMSQGQVTLSDVGMGLFCGHLSLENNGGFTLIRRHIDLDDFKNNTGFLLKSK